MNIGQIEEMVSRAIAQLESAKMRLVKSLNICYPRMVGPKERAEIRATASELAMAHNEIGMAEHLTMEVVKKLGDFTRANEEAEAQRQTQTHPEGLSGYIPIPNPFTNSE